MYDQDTSPAAESQSRVQWNQVRRKVFFERLYSTLGISKQPINLLAFDEVRAKLRLNQNAYRGLQQVPLDQIVGSVGRYHDFTRTFLPLSESDSWRWQRVATLQAESGLPPIELYKVGDAYFVKDGNHRVSVARAYGAGTIEAYVWEYESKVGGFSPETDLDDLIVKAEYRQFLDNTRLDVLRPDQRIELSEPGMYPELELQIALYRENLRRIDGEDHSQEDAVTAWYDMVYTLAVEQITESGVLKLFPGRTEADLFVWTSRHQKELRERYGERVSWRDAVQQLVEEKTKPGPVERLVQSAARFVQNLTTSTGSEETEPPPLPTEADEPLGKLVARLSGVEPALTYRDERGDAWRAWKQEVREKLHEILGSEYWPVDEVSVEQIETNLLSGVERTKIRLRAADGLLIPGYIMRPADNNDALPGLLVYPGSGSIRQTAGVETSSHHANALALAQSGYVTITLEARGFGELGQVDARVLDSVGRAIGRTWLATVLDDGRYALDYLRTRPDVLPEHLGVTGLGLGGGLACFTAALDERVRTAVIENYVGALDPLRPDYDYLDLVPGLLTYMTWSDIARLIVPRPVLYAYPSNRPSTQHARAWFDAVRPVYELFSCPDRTRFVEHDQDDDYECCGATQWFDRWLAEEEDTSVLLWAPRE